jgi:protein-S-isoprenylcysteine O-methyltransferase Ste14
MGQQRRQGQPRPGGTGGILARTLIFTLLVPGTVTVGVPYLLLASGRPVPSHGLGQFRWLGILPVALGVSGYLWCAWTFAAAGRGTPGPWDPPRKLVARGLYRFTRNPMYLAVGSILLGEAVFHPSWVLAGYTALVGLLFHLRVVSFEEPALRREFGDAYEAYCRSVPRWLRLRSRTSRAR